MAPDFNDLLNKQADQVEKLPPLPAGSYRWVINSHEKIKAQSSGNEGIMFKIKPLEAQADVDEALLDSVKLEDESMALKFWVTAKALWRLTDFLEHCGLDKGQGTVAELIELSVGCEFIGEVKHELGSGGDPYATINTTAAV